MKLPRLVSVGGRLALICTIAAVILALVNAVTAPVIVENKAMALREGLIAVADRAGIAGLTLGEQSTVEDVDQVVGFFPLVAAAKPAAYVVQLVGVGYGGDMNLLAGFYPDGELFAAQMMDNLETPGLGKKAEEAAYMEKFLGRGGAERIPTRRSDLAGQDADAITGATITFIGVARALDSGSSFVAAIETSVGSSQ